MRVPPLTVSSAFAILSLSSPALISAADVPVCTNAQKEVTILDEDKYVRAACPSLYFPAGSGGPLLIPGRTNQLTVASLNAVAPCSANTCISTLQEAVRAMPDCYASDVFNPKAWYTSVYGLCTALGAGTIKTVRDALEFFEDDTSSTTDASFVPISKDTTNDTSVPPVPTPSPAQSVAEKSGNSVTAVIAVCGGVIVVVLSVVILIMWKRRKRRDKLDLPTTPQGTPGYAYIDPPTARTETDALTESDLLRGGLELAAVRIPYKALQFGEVLSQGGFGEVTRGQYNGKEVAVKRLLAARRKDLHSIRNFFKEIQLTATLDHECIVAFIGVSWDVPANLCMISEFMDGGDMRSLLEAYKQRGHANGHDDTKLKMAVQVAHALTYLHTLSTPVVHRDLKSRNILLSREGDAKLIDFGISCERQDVTMTAGVGTSLWMAPEVMLGQRYDEKADVFSFGVILSELDTHELPYDHARDTVSGQPIPNMVLLQLISEGKLKPRFTPMVDPQMVALAKDCLEVDPTKRPLASQVLYRIHQSRRNDREMALDTRTAIDRSLLTLNTVSGARFGYDL